MAFSIVVLLLSSMLGSTAIEVFKSSASAVTRYSLKSWLPRFSYSCRHASEYLVGLALRLLPNACQSAKVLIPDMSISSGVSPKGLILTPPVVVTSTEPSSGRVVPFNGVPRSSKILCISLAWVELSFVGSAAIFATSLARNASSVWLVVPPAPKSEPTSTFPSGPKPTPKSAIVGSAGTFGPWNGVSTISVVGAINSS